MLGEGGRDPRTGGKEEAMVQLKWRNFGKTATWGSISGENGEQKNSTHVRIFMDI